MLSSSSDALSAPAAAPATILGVLREPGVLRSFGLSLLARFPLASVGVLYVLCISPTHGYAAAGVVDALYAVSMAIAGMIWGRMMQRVAIGRIALPLSVVNGAAIAGAGLLPGDAPLWAFAGLAVLNGVSMPSYGGAMRALWDQLVQREDERHIGYALEGSLGEVVWLVSPAVIIGAVAGTVGPHGALIAGGLLGAVAGAAYSLAPAVWRARTTDEAARSKGALGTLRYAGVRTAIAMSVAMGYLIGPVEIGIAAYGRAHGGSAIVGLLLALWGTGGIVVGLALARRPPSPHPARRMIAFAMWATAWSAAFALADSTVAVGVVLVASGAVLSPIFITMNASFDRLAPPGAEAEIYNLTMAGVLFGTMTAAPATGAMIDRHGPLAGAVLSVIGGLLLIAILVVRRRDFAARLVANERGDAQPRDAASHDASSAPVPARASSRRPPRARRGDRARPLRARSPGPASAARGTPRRAAGAAPRPRRARFRRRAAR